MSSNLESIYFEEAKELIQGMESSLLALESSPEDKQLLEEVFRSMHTLKGNSSMFGFTQIAEFLHEFETIYSRLRDGALNLSKELLDISLNSLDHLSKIILDPELKEASNKQLQLELLEKLRQALELDSSQNSAVGSNALLEETGMHTYFIQFIPHRDILLNGTRPLYLLDELSELGTCKVIPRFAPFDSIEVIDFTQSYASWEILLATKSTHNDILDVFVFVQGESEITVEEVAPYNLFIHTETEDFLEERMALDAEKITLKALQELEKMLPSPQLPAAPGEKTQQAAPKAIVKSVASTVRVSTDTLGEVMNLLGELVTAQAGLNLYATENTDSRLAMITEDIEKISRQLREAALSMTLIPLDSIFPRFQRLVRDLSDQLDKKVELVTEGGDTSLDKKIIETITDPLMHIVRNCLDHGIEEKEERATAGKPESAKVKLSSFYSGGAVHIRISDDGRGIDPEKIRAKAIEKGVIENDTVLSKQETLNLIFAAGFSTATEVSDVSGRGVGMDVVRRNMAEARGKVLLTSDLGKGTVVEIILPLTLSIIDGLLVEIDQRSHVIPLEQIEKCYEVPVEELEDNLNNTIILNGEQIPLVKLESEFDIETTEESSSKNVIVVKNEHLKVGLCVDAIVGELQAVLKPLGKYYAQQDFVTGATVLGDGSVALVLNPFKLIQDKVQHKAIAS